MARNIGKFDTNLLALRIRKAFCMFKLPLFICLSIAIYLYIARDQVEIYSQLEEKKVSQALIKDERLHKGFEKILANKDASDRGPSSEQEVKEVEVINNFEKAPSFHLSDEYWEKFQYELTDEQRTEAFNNLRIEISNDEETIENLRKMGEDEFAAVMESNLDSKKRQFEQFSTLVE